MQGELHRALPAAAALRRPLLLLALLGLAAAAPAAGEAPAVARAHLVGVAEPAGNAFFLAAGEQVVAVGTAHAFDRTALAEAGALEFRVPGGAEPVAEASRYYAAPGTPYHLSGGTLAGDFVVFKLAEAPVGVRVLAPRREVPEPGTALRILGLDRAGGGAASLSAVVVESGPDRVVAELEGFADLRGWGGAPAVAAEAGGVVGLLQSARPLEGRLRVEIGPLAGVLAAVAEPLDEGLGRPFTAYAPLPSAANDLGARRRRATGSRFASLDPRETARRVNRAIAGAAPPAPLAPAERVLLEVERPTPGAVLGSSSAFVAGHAGALGPTLQRFDVMLVIDTSLSTAYPAGVDVDGDGVVGTELPLTPDRDGLAGSTDEGDSTLAAELAAAERLLAGLDPRTTRVGIVSFAGEATQPATYRETGRRFQGEAITQEALTSDFRRLRLGLERVREAGSAGGTHISGAVDLALLELLGLPGAVSHPLEDSEKVVLFLTDGYPTLPYPWSAGLSVRAALGAARRARLAGVRVHTFAIGPDALSRPVTTVELAAISGGIFTPVRHPGTLSEFIGLLSFARIEGVEVANASSGRAAYHVRAHPDGSWDALVPLEPGENEIVVTARASGGAEASERVTVLQRPGADDPVMPTELLPRHNALLEMRLETIRTQRLEIMRKELVLEMEAERAAALERAEIQRKELELDAEAW